MNDIKFRAWDIDEKKWINDYEFYIDMNGTPTLCDTGYDPYTRELTNCILEQYICINDKSGKCIYDGDIVVHWHEELFFKDNVVGVVKWDDKSAGYCIEYSDCSQLISVMDTDYANIEIIGNIHENPELIK